VNRRMKLGLVGAGIVVVALVVFFLLINPIRGEISELRLQVDDENAKIAKAEQGLRVAEATRSEGRRNQALLMELAKMIPSTPEIPSLILQIQDMADKAGIDWMQVSPSAPRAVEGAAYQIVPLSLTFSGSFYDVSDFIYRAEQMVAGPGRLLAVKDLALTIEKIKGGGSVPFAVTMNVNMTMSSFVMAQAPAPAPAPAASPPSGSAGGATTTTVKTQ
jgi:type IV pilus assembly protein PilO